MNDLSSSSGSMLVHHRDYYLPGGDVVFLVENSLFRVHKYFFERESPVLRRLLAQPVTPDQKRVGSTDSNALVLDVRSDDFAKLLWVFYNPKYSMYHTTIADWIKILRLAHLYEFEEVKLLVARELNKLEMPAIQKIVLYHDHGLDRACLLPEYVAMCRRNLREPDTPFLTDEEGESLGVKTVLRFFEIREKLLRRSNRDESDIEALVKKAFELVVEEQTEEARGGNPAKSATDGEATATAVATPITKTDNSSSLTNASTGDNNTNGTGYVAGTGAASADVDDNSTVVESETPGQENVSTVDLLDGTGDADGDWSKGAGRGGKSKGGSKRGRGGKA